MPDDTPATGFRSLVEQIQEKDADAAERARPVRRRLSLRRDSRPGTAGEAPEPFTREPGTAPLRLLERRWL